MKKKYIAFVLSLFFSVSLWAQNVQVKCFELDPTDLTAQHENVKDANGDMCALIKVQIVSNNVQFAGDIMGEPRHNQNEYYVYVLDGTTYLTISTESTLPTEIEFAKYSNEVSSVKGGCTYILKIGLPEKAPGVTFEVGMPDVPITVDGKAYKTDETGALDLPLAKGSYSYSINMEGYKQYEGTIEIDKIPVIKDIKLERGDGLVDKGLLTITYPIDAVLTIVPSNSSTIAPAKKTYKTGEQIALNGDYQITFKKKKYISQTMTISVKSGDNIKKAFPEVALEVDLKIKSYDFNKAFKEYKKVADKGDDCAQYKLGCFYLDGKGTSPNKNMAKHYLTLAANQGNLNAYRKLYETASSDLEKINLLKQMADKGDGEAMVTLAHYYERQSIWNEMRTWLQKACSMNEKHAFYEMGNVYYEGKGCVQNYARAYKYFAIAASYEFALAKERMLDYQFLGLDGQEQNQKVAVEGYLKLGTNLSDDGKYKVGMFYYEKYEKSEDFMMLSFAKNYFTAINPATASESVHWTAKAQDVFNRLAKTAPTNEAVFYYRLSECAGEKSANLFNQLGTAYRLGNGVNADESKAFQYYKKSNDMGDREGCCWLGFCYEKGIGVQRNLKEAIILYQRAEQLGSTTAAGYLGTMYAQGIAGLPKNMNKAVTLWTKAAKDGNVSSMRNLIRYYQKQKNSKQVQYWNTQLKKI